MITDYDKYMDKFTFELMAHETVTDPRLMWQLLQDCAGGDVLKAYEVAENYCDEMIMQLHDTDTVMRFKQAGLIGIEQLVQFRQEYYKLSWPKIS